MTNQMKYEDRNRAWTATKNQERLQEWLDKPQLPPPQPEPEEPKDWRWWAGGVVGWLAILLVVFGPLAAILAIEGAGSIGWDLYGWAVWLGFLFLVYVCAVGRQVRRKNEMKEKSVNQAARTLGKARWKNTSPEERKAQAERIAEDLNVALHMLGPNAYASVTGEEN